MEKWLHDLAFFKKTLSAPAAAAVSEQSNECFVSPQSAIDAAQTKTMTVENPSLNDQLPAVTSSDCANPQRILNQSKECNAFHCDDFADDIKPTDSISNVYSKKIR